MMGYEKFIPEKTLWISNPQEEIESLREANKQLAIDAHREESRLRTELEAVKKENESLKASVYGLYELESKLAACQKERDELIGRPVIESEWQALQRALASKQEALYAQTNELNSVREQLAEVTRERDAYKNVHFMADTRADMSVSLLEKTLKELAASQAREKVLREALCNCIDNFEHERNHDLIHEALSHPTDDSALRQWGAKLLREMAENVCGECDVKLWSRAEELGK